MIYTSKKNLIQTADYIYGKLNDNMKKLLRGNCREIACRCKHGYTVDSLWLHPSMGLIYCEGYGEYCEIMASKR